MKLGFVVNPVAGMGGKVGLKGTDDVVEEAVSRGAEMVAPKRAVEFLSMLKRDMEKEAVEVVACPGIMGEEEALEAGFDGVRVLPMKVEEKTSAEDTKVAVRLLVNGKADLIVFVGGDGTAKDVLNALGDGVVVPVLGVPSGVKMYSGVFAVSPADAVDVVLAFARGEAEISEFEVMDADETAIRADVFAVKLHGYLKCPFLPLHVQGSKMLSPETVDERENQLAIARFVVEGLERDAVYVLGPGTTVKCVAEQLGVEKTLLGVDVLKDREVVLDVDEKKILRLIDDWEKAWIVLSPIGRQGILLGRGNQQISPEIVRRVGRERILVLATKSKLESIEGGVLRVDSGDVEVDEMLRGYGRVVTDYREWRLVQIR